MGADNKLELVIQIDANGANASIKSINRGLSDMEQAAVKSARGASGGIDSISISVAKGAASAALLVSAFERVIGIVREYTVEAAMLAARNETLAVVNAQLARANGYSGDSIERLVERLKGLGITTQASRDVVNKMIASQLDLSKATELARLAQDSAVVSGENSSQALQGIIHGITTQQIEVLRTYGINVQFERVFQEARVRLGRDLTDLERKNLAFQRVLGEAPKIAGAYEASLGTVGKQLTSLARYTEEAKAAIGTAFLPEMRKAVTALTEVAKWAKDNADSIATFAKGLAAAALAAAVAKFISWMAEAQRAVTGLTLALVRNPFTALAVAATFAGVELYSMYQDSKSLEEQLKKQNKEAADTLNIFYQIGERGKTLEQLKQMGYSVEQIRKAFQGAREGTDDFMAGFDASEFTNRIKVVNLKELEEVRKTEAIQLAREITKRQADATKGANDLLLRSAEERKSAEHDVARQRIEDSMRVIEATRSEATASKESLNVILLSRQEHAAGVAKIREDEKREIESRSTFVDDKGVLRRFTLKGDVLDRIHQATTEKIAAFDLRFNEEEARRVEGMWKALGDRIKASVDVHIMTPIRQSLYIAEQGFKLDDQRKDTELSNARAAIDQRKNLELAQLESVDAVTVRQKLWVEQRKTQIETDAIRGRTDIELKELDRRTEYQIREAEKAANAQGIFDEERIAAIKERIQGLSDLEKKAAGSAAENEIATTAAKGAAAQKATVIDYYRTLFTTLKNEVGGVFDALVSKSESVWSAIANTFKKAMLNAIKEVVTSRIAAAMLQMFTSARTTFQQNSLGGAGGGGLSSLGGLLGMGAIPTFGGGGGGGQLVIPGGGIPGVATPTFTGQPVVLSGGGSAAGAGAGGSGLGQLAGVGSMWKSIKSSLSGLGNIGYGPKDGDFGGEVAGSYKGVGGVSGGLLLAGGAALAMDGLRRGGWVGFGETTAGGAAVGAKFGGPVGAAIGAGIGAVAGLTRMLFKTAEEKIRQKVNQVYRVDISDKGILEQIADIAKSAYGGNLDVAIRSPQVRELIDLYAMSTGKSTGIRTDVMRSADMVQSGGQLYQSQTYDNGQGYAFQSQSGLSILGGQSGQLIVDPLGQNRTPMVSVTMSLNERATTDVLHGHAIQAVSDNPRAVSDANQQARTASYNRTSERVASWEPLTTTS